MRRALAIAALAAVGGLAGLAACSDSTATYSEQPIPLELAGPGGGLLGVGSVSTQAGSTEASGATRPSFSSGAFPLLVDTGSPLTAFVDGSGVTSVSRGALQLFASGAAPVARLAFDDIPLFATPLAGSGLDQATPIGGVLGGDNLQRFVLDLRYSPSPLLAITSQLILSECELSERCAAVLRFSLGGGRQLIDLSGGIYGYPASYVLLSGCVEPALDPLEAQLACTSREGCNETSSCVGTPDQVERCVSAITDCQADAERYLPHGIDVRFAVATGFPGLALTASAYDRLRGRGSSADLLALGGHTLFLPDQGVGSTGVAVGTTSLGSIALGPHDGAARAAIALVDPDGYFGACASLGRSRRLRRAPPERQAAATDVSCLRSPKENPSDALLRACADQTSGSNNCDDTTGDAHTNAYLELAGPLPIIIVPDTISLLQNINADVRPQSATVEGVIGTEFLRRVGTTIDYANRRVIATCQDASCRAFPRTGHATDCQAPSGELLFGGGRARTFSADAQPGSPPVGCTIP